MAEHGGYRRPSNPAAVSNPGSMSQRTDGRPQAIRDLPDAEYGAGKEFRELQQGSPLASAPQTSTPVGGAGAGGDPLSAMVGFDAASTMPNTPVTDGADAGDGAGMDALGLPNKGLKGEIAVIGKYLPVLIRQADSPDATPAFRAYVRRLLGAV